MHILNIYVMNQAVKEFEVNYLEVKVHADSLCLWMCGTCMLFSEFYSTKVSFPISKKKVASLTIKFLLGHP